MSLPAGPTQQVTPSMSFGESIATVFRKYADFTGTASRSEFWWFMLFLVLAGAVLGTFTAWTPYGVSVQIGSTLSSLWSIAVLLPSLAVSVRRLRDAGRSWAELFWLLLPVAGPIVLIVHLAEGSRP